MVALPASSKEAPKTPDAKEEQPLVDVVVNDEDSDQPAQATPSSGDSAADDYEMVDKSVDSLGKAKSTGAQGPGSSKKRRGKKK
jgi:hypothetical protein